MEAALEESVVRVIALRQPVAADLRVLIAAMKIATTLERIGDLAKNIAKRAIPLSSARPVKLTASIVRMGRQTLTQLSDVLNAHASRDVDLAVQIWNQDVRDRRDVQRHLPRGGDLHGRGQPADRRRRAADVHRQEPRADRRPHHAYLRDGLLHRHRREPRRRPARRASPPGIDFVAANSRKRRRCPQRFWWSRTRSRSASSSPTTSRRRASPSRPRPTATRR